MADSPNNRNPYLEAPDTLARMGRGFVDTSDITDRILDSVRARYGWGLTAEQAAQREAARNDDTALYNRGTQGQAVDPWRSAGTYASLGLTSPGAAAASLTALMRRIADAKAANPNSSVVDALTAELRRQLAAAMPPSPPMPGQNFQAGLLGSVDSHPALQTGLLRSRSMEP